MAKFKRVAVLMGGVASEREVSLRSGKAVAAGLRSGGYDVVEVDVKSEEFALPEGIEAAFIALHGRFGEDGGAQARLTELGIPFTGSGIESSRVSFDKVLTRARLAGHGIRVPHGEVIRKASERTLSCPLVVKPPREGSSVGCHLVFEEGDFDAAFQDAATYSSDVLVEEYIAGRELTVGVVEGKALPVVEIKPQGEWYDFEAKYVTGDTDYICPAELDASLVADLQEVSLKTFQSLGADTFGRVDFRLSADQFSYVLELNAIPGFTETSLLPKAAAAAGIGFSELCCRILERAHL